jgi:two-component system, LytTR family, response regulator
VQRATNGTDDGERLLVPERGTIHLVPIREIEWVQADDYYLWLHTAARAWMLRERMHRLEAQLTRNDFLRVHRSSMVRCGAVVSLELHGTEPAVLVRSGARVRVARDRLSSVRERLATSLPTMP